ncbi:MAG TPA: MFS transporter [Casimicrobiaceae bacterium]|nr:MFS transporter [Casimicrobiaceae bacterium]
MQSEARATPGATVYPMTGLGRNWRQFSLLVVVNAFVGGMVGLERAVMPLLAEREFGLVSTSAMLTFIVSFGIVKALTNLVAGRASEHIGRKALLVAGWIAGLAVPFLLLWAPTWGWIVLANVFLGINQGLCWSMTVIMKIDLAGPKRRGLAMGLNEFAGYVAVALAAWACAELASSHGLRIAPFVLGVAFASIGLILSIAFVRDTTEFAHAESHHANGAAAKKSLKWVFFETSLRDRTLIACSQAGLINNLNDGAAWGLFPLLFVRSGVSVAHIGALAAIYPAVWGLSQVGAGALSDRWGRKWLIAAGMWVQAVGIWIVAASTSLRSPYAAWIGGSVLLGLGTALVYPTLLAAVSDRAHPGWRASAVGVYRLWRDLGYAVGAVLSGVIADAFGLVAAIVFVGALTALSGVIVAFRMIDSPVQKSERSHGDQQPRPRSERDGGAGE